MTGPIGSIIGIIQQSTCWCIHQSRQWWVAASSGVFGVSMSQDTFEVLVTELRPAIKKV